MLLTTRVKFVTIVLPMRAAYLTILGCIATVVEFFQLLGWRGIDVFLIKTCFFATSFGMGFVTASLLFAFWRL